MDSDIVKLFISMDGALSFVESIEALKDKQQPFLDAVEGVLQTIEECTSHILNYLQVGVAGSFSLTVNTSTNWTNRSELGSLCECREAR